MSFLGHWRLLERSEVARLAMAGVLLALAFPPLPFGLLTLVALTPLLSVLDHDPRPGFRRGFLHGTVFGTVFYLILLFWLWDLVRFTPLIVPTWALSSLYLGCLVGLSVGAAHWLHARTGRSPAFFLPFAWIGLEKLLQYGDLRFTWGVLADTLAPYPVLLQSGELWGSLGLGFLVVAANGLAYTLWRCRAQPRVRRRAGTALAGMAAAVLVYGIVRWNAYGGLPAARTAVVTRPTSASAAGATARAAAVGTSPAAGKARMAAPSVRIAVIQPDIPQEARDDPNRVDFEKERLFDLSRRALAERPDLVVWPETATPWLRYDHDYLNDLRELCCGGSARAAGGAGAGRGGERDLAPGVSGGAGTAAAAGAGGVPFLVGGLDMLEPPGPGQPYYNAAFLVSATGELTGVYRKVLLVPMTEKVPYSGVLSFLKPERWSGSFGSGEGFFPLAFEPREAGRESTVQVGVPICYEITFPQAIRSFRRRGARLIVTITNDAWFGKTAAPFQHFSQLALRAVENRIAVARSANTGISGFVSPRGDVVAKTDIFEPGLLVVDVPLAGPLTPYARWGDWIVPAAWAGLAAFLAATTAGRRSKRRAAARAPRVAPEGEAAPPREPACR